MKCGLGNWADISSQFVDTKTPKDCEEHYFNFYYKSRNDRIPSDKDFIVNGTKQIKPDGSLYIPIDEELDNTNQQRVRDY